MMCNAQAQLAEWVVDPARAGSTQPPAGQSLFDQLTGDFNVGKTGRQLPFPLPALLQHIGQHFVEDEDPIFTALLIPLGRSLQRFAGDPDYFKFPRVVIAYDRDSPARHNAEGIFLKDRLFIGYSEAAGILEVISYNDIAGRFEFQIVENYRANSEAQVSYADRTVCTTCHQNHAPLFARSEWDETNANANIASLLEQQKKDFYSLPVRQGLSQPEAFDTATDRANWFSLYQLFWREVCSGDTGALRQCRAQALLAALQYRLTGSRPGNQRSKAYQVYSDTLREQWDQLWPQGLAIPNPDIPNRRPVASLSDIPDDWKERITTQEEFLPSLRRLPLELWSDYQPEFASRMISGLAAFFTKQDIQELDRILYMLESNAPVKHYQASCQARLLGDKTLGELRLRCEADFSLEAYLAIDQGELISGRMRRLTFADQAPLSHLNIVPETTRSTADEINIFALHESAAHLHARDADGNAISRFQIHELDINDHNFSNDRFQVRVTLTIKEDFDALANAVKAMASPADANAVLSNPVFNRRQLLADLYTRLLVDMPGWLTQSSVELNSNSH